MDYTTIEQIENYTLQDIVDSYEPQVEDWIEGVSRMMDTLANRTLVAPAVGSGEEFPVRYFDGNDKENLKIDDCQEIDAITIGDFYGDNPVEVDTTAYVVSPRNAPHRTLVLKSGIFTKGVQNVAVSGRFGFFNEVPKDLEFACTVLVAGLINAQNNSSQSKKSESIGNYSVTYIDDKGIADYKRALEIISYYRKIDF